MQVENEQLLTKQYNCILRKQLGCEVDFPCFFIDTKFEELNFKGKFTYDDQDRSKYLAKLKNLYGLLQTRDTLNVKNIVEPLRVINAPNFVDFTKNEYITVNWG